MVSKNAFVGRALNIRVRILFIGVVMSTMALKVDVSVHVNVRTSLQTTLV